MLNSTPEQKQALAKKNLAINLPFFIKALKVDLEAEDLEALTARISSEYNIYLSENSFAMIFGMFDKKDCSDSLRWAEFVRVCNKFLNSHYYIPFMDDVANPTPLMPNNPHYILVVKSKIYFSGLIAKRLLSKEETDELKEIVNAQVSEAQ